MKTVFLTVVILIASVGFLFAGITLFSQDIALSDHGQKTTLINLRDLRTMTTYVTGVELPEMTTADAQFLTSEGQMVTKSGLLVTDQMRTAFAMGKDLVITYLPENPQITRSPMESKLLYIIVFTVFGLFFLFTGMGLIWLIRLEREKN
jgi:hypothetical protein